MCLKKLAIFIVFQYYYNTKCKKDTLKLQIKYNKCTIGVFDEVQLSTGGKKIAVYF